MAVQGDLLIADENTAVVRILLPVDQLIRAFGDGGFAIGIENVQVGLVGFRTLAGVEVS